MFNELESASLSYIPDDFVTNVKQISSQSDLTSMSSFAGPSYLTVRSSLCIILIRDPCIFNLYNLCQTGSSYLRRKPHQRTLRFNEQITRTHFLLLQLSIIPAQVIVERAAKTLHQNSASCTSVSVPAKITWTFFVISTKDLLLQNQRSGDILSYYIATYTECLSSNVISDVIDLKVAA